MSSTAQGSVTTEIHARLTALERDRQVNVLYACESGSRAWGFASRDSDYDVRFIYRHPPGWYLSVFDGRDVIEAPPDQRQLWDLSGWELRKSLRLLWRGNPVLHEWLASPIVYRERPAFAVLRELATAAFRPRAACYHYLALARRYRRRLFESERPISAKTYLYALRPLLCCRWIVDRGGAPPMPLSDLLAARPGPAEAAAELERLLAEKARGREGDRSSRRPALEDWLDRLSEELQAAVLPAEPPRPPQGSFDRVLQALLADAGTPS